MQSVQHAQLAPQTQNLQGTGEVYSFSVMYSVPKGYEDQKPYTVALIKLDEGPIVTAQLTDVAVFNRLRAGAWWKAPLVSTLVSSSLDTAIFFTIAFSAALTALEPMNDVSWAGEMLPLLGLGPVAPLWVPLAVADWLVKLLLAIAALLPFRIIVARLIARVA